MNTSTFESLATPKLKADYNLTIRNAEAHARFTYTEPKWYEKFFYRVYFHFPLVIIFLCIWCLLELWA